MLASGEFPPPDQTAAKSENEAAAFDVPPRLPSSYSVPHIAAVALSTVSPPSLEESCMSHRAEATLPAEPSAKLVTYPLASCTASSRSTGTSSSWYRALGLFMAKNGKKWDQPSLQAHAGLVVAVMPKVHESPTG